jgi:hypothetical protein
VIWSIRKHIELKTSLQFELVFLNKDFKSCPTINKLPKSYKIFLTQFIVRVTRCFCDKITQFPLEIAQNRVHFCHIWFVTFTVKLHREIEKPKFKINCPSLRKRLPYWRNMVTQFFVLYLHIPFHRQVPAWILKVTH